MFTTEERRNYIGGSDIAAILGMSRWKTPLKLWLEKTGEVEPDDLSENEKNILITLREYGINIIDMKINKEILSEIAEHLNIRYSTYDVMHAVLKLANSDSANKNTYKRIADKYIRF